MQCTLPSCVSAGGGAGGQGEVYALNVHRQPRHLFDTVAFTQLCCVCARARVLVCMQAGVVRQPQKKPNFAYIRDWKITFLLLYFH